MWRLATVDWTQAAALATFVSVVVGGGYVFVKWVRGLLRQEIREVVAPMFEQATRKMDVVHGDIRDHMTTEDLNRDNAVQAVNEWGERLEHQISQLQWRSKNPPEVIENGE